MKNPISIIKSFGRSNFKRFIRVLYSLWTLVLLCILVEDLFNQRHTTLEMARNSAYQSYKKDLLYRRWTAMHGGVYVPITETTPPNPRMAHITNRDITTADGQRLTLINPAYMSRQVYDLDQGQSGLSAHLTSLNPLGIGNVPDPWEAAALAQFETGVTEISEIAELHGAKHLRYMRPLLVEPQCLKCHATQGYSVGDIRGGISVSIPMAPLWAIERELIIEVGFGLALIWIVGIAGIFVGSRSIKKEMNERAHYQISLQKSHDELEIRVEERNRELIQAGEEMAERLKELRCMYATARIIHQNISWEEIFQSVVNVIPSGWQYPEITRGKIIFDGIEYYSEPFDETEWHQKSDIIIDGAHRGSVEVYYMEPHPDFDDGPFLKEERNLIEGITITLIEGLERDKAETALQESFQELSALHENATEGIYRSSVNGEIIYANPAMAKIFGYDCVEDFQQCDSQNFYYDKAEREKLMQLIIDGREISNHEIHYIRKDGSDLWALLSAVPVNDDHNQIRYLEGFVRDISEQVKARKAQRESEERFRQFFENAPEYCYMVNPDGKIIDVNQVALNALEYTKEEMLGKPLSFLYTPASRSKAKELFKRWLKTGELINEELTVVTKQGAKRNIILSAASIYDDQGNLLHSISIQKDVTEKIKMETQILRSQRMDSLGTLAGGIAHDLNNVLSPILLSLQMLRHGEQDEKTAQLLKSLESNTMRAADMVRQILVFARGSEGAHQVLQTGDLVQEIAEIGEKTFPKNIDIKTQITSKLWCVSGDPTQLHQVLLNLCVNARDAMSSGGSLTIKAENVHVSKKMATLSNAEKPGPYVRIQVIDTGKGISKEIIESIFDPFFTTKELGEGTGLGLYTVHSIVKNHGGFLSVYSEEDQGTNFKIYLPASESSADTQETAVPTDIPLGHGELILLVDDEVLIREVIREALESSFYRVVTAADGIEAAAIYAESQTEISLVITDLMMPLMDGKTTIKVLRKINPEVKVIAASGLSPDLADSQYVDLNVDAFLQKPFSVDILLETMANVLLKTCSLL